MVLASVDMCFGDSLSYVAYAHVHPPPADALTRAHSGRHVRVVAIAQEATERMCRPPETTRQRRGRREGTPVRRGYSDGVAAILRTHSTCALTAPGVSPPHATAAA